MPVQDISGVVAIEGAFSILDGLVAGGAVDGAKLHLFKDTLNPTSATDWDTFHTNEATFKGYASKAPTWSTTGFDSTGTPVSTSSVVNFQATDATDPNSIGGA